MTPDDFYVFEPPLDSDAIVTEGSWLEGRTQIDCPYCPKCGAIFGMLRTRPPLLMELRNEGRGFADIVWMPGYSILFSQRVFDAIEEAGYTRTLDVIGHAVVLKVKNRKRSFSGEPPLYFSCEANSGPAIDLIASGMVRTEPIKCRYCLKGGVICTMKRLVVDMATWGGEDIFRPRGLLGTVVVTRRFAVLLRELKATGFTLLPALHFSIDYSRAFPKGVPSVPPPSDE